DDLVIDDNRSAEEVAVDGIDGLRETARSINLPSISVAPFHLAPRRRPFLYLFEIREVKGCEGRLAEKAPRRRHLGQKEAGPCVGESLLEIPGQDEPLPGIRPGGVFGNAVKEVVFAVVGLNGAIDIVDEVLDGKERGPLVHVDQAHHFALELRVWRLARIE